MCGSGPSSLMRSTRFASNSGFWRTPQARRSKEIIWFRTGKLQRGKGAESAKTLVTKYKNRRGETRFQGNRNMAKSAILVFDVSVFLFIEQSMLLMANSCIPCLRSTWPSSKMSCHIGKTPEPMRVAVISLHFNPDYSLSNTPYKEEVMK